MILGFDFIDFICDLYFYVFVKRNEELMKIIYFYVGIVFERRVNICKEIKELVFWKDFVLYFSLIYLIFVFKEFKSILKVLF